MEAEISRRGKRLPPQQKEEAEQHIRGRDRSRTRSRDRNTALSRLGLKPALEGKPFCTALESSSSRCSKYSVTTPFEYTPLDSARNEIRLVRVESCEHKSVWCGVFVVSLDQAPEYEALSYTWGDPSELSSVPLNGQLLEVTSNLSLALHQLGDGNRILWIDAICINQADEDERSSQVAKMRSIYARASNVLVWLGDTYEGSELAFSLLRDVYEHRQDDGAVHDMINDPDKHRHLKGLSRLFNREYWRRIWVVQEINVAEKIIVHCGADEMDWIAMTTAQQFLWSTLGDFLKILSTTVESCQDLFQSVRFRGPQSLYLDVVNYSRDWKRLGLFETLIMHRLKLSTDPRDKVYALVGLTTAEDDPDYVIDYSLSVRQVYINTVDYVVKKSQTLDVILARTRGILELDLPSWVPNWVSGGKGRPLPYRHAVRDSYYNASDNRTPVAEISCEMGILKAYGVCIGSVQSVGPPSAMSWTDDYDNGLITFHNWNRYFCSSTEISSDRIVCENLAKLLVCELFGEVILLGNSRAEYLRVIVRSFLRYTQRRFPRIAIAPNLLYFVERVYAADFKAESWVQAGLQMLSMRRPFVTSDGGMGLAETTVVGGDRVCILFGCSIPVILRKVNDHYIYMSDACVVDYMHGKGMEEFEKGKFQEEMFEIH